MSEMASQITSFSIVCSAIYSGGDQSKHLSSASLSFVQGIHPWPVNSSRKRPVKRKMFPFDDVIILAKKLTHHMLAFVAVVSMPVQEADLGALIYTTLRFRLQWQKNIMVVRLCWAVQTRSRSNNEALGRSIYRIYQLNGKRYDINNKYTLSQGLCFKLIYDRHYRTGSFGFHTKH